MGTYIYLGTCVRLLRLVKAMAYITTYNFGIIDICILQLNIAYGPISS